MNRHDKILLYGLVLFSVATSFTFLYHCVSVTAVPDQSEWTTVFAYLTGAYALANLYILSWAWQGRSALAPGANKLVAICYWGVYGVDVYRSGIQSGLEVVGFAGIALVLWVNWTAVSKVVKRPV